MLYSLILAHGPIAGVIAYAMGIVGLTSLLIALPVWWLSLPRRPGEPRTRVSSILIALCAVLISWGAAALWLATGWTIAGRVSADAPEWYLLGVVVLPSAIAGATYVWHRRARPRNADVPR